jgi:hypothetical protein
MAATRRSPEVLELWGELFPDFLEEVADGVAALHRDHAPVTRAVKERVRHLQRLCPKILRP